MGKIKMGPNDDWIQVSMWFLYFMPEKDMEFVVNVLFENGCVDYKMKTRHISLEDFTLKGK